MSITNRVTSRLFYINVMSRIFVSITILSLKTQSKLQAGAVRNAESTHTMEYQQRHRTVAMALLCFTASGKGKTCNNSANHCQSPPPRKKATTDTNKLEPPSRSHTETESTSSTHKSPQIKETEGIP